MMGVESTVSVLLRSRTGDSHTLDRKYLLFRKRKRRKLEKESI